MGCTGVCVAHKKRGEPCSAHGNDGLCGHDDYCARPPGPYAAAGVCKEKKSEGAECLEWNSCKAGLECLGFHTWRDEPEAPEEISPGHCTPPGIAGVECRPGRSDCAPAFACDFATKKCAPRATAASACHSPESCGDGLACVGLEARWNAYGQWSVDVPGTCAPFADVGSACDAKAIETGCPRSTRCDAKSGTCVRAGHEGDACKPNGGCNSHLYCNWQTSTCAGRLQMGAACAPPPKGYEYDEQCFLGKCNPAERVCVPLSECGP
jgi:hypothetical protein